MTCAEAVHPHVFKRTAAPTVEPMTPAEAQEYIRGGSEAETARLLASARDRVEGYLERALLEQSWVAHLDGFWGTADLELPMTNLLEVTSIKYLADETDTETTVATTVYEVDTVSVPGRVRLKPGQSWPTAYARPNAVRVAYKAGYGVAASAVPERVLQAVRLLLSHYDRNREAVLTGTIQAPLAEGVVSLLELERVAWPGD